MCLEEGRLTSSKFYDTDPSTGPKDSTTIHGKSASFVLLLQRIQILQRTVARLL